MNKYSVYVQFTNGKDAQFETNTNVLMQQPVHINGGEFIITENNYAINLLHIDYLDLAEYGLGILINQYTQFHGHYGRIFHDYKVNVEFTTKIGNYGSLAVTAYQHTRMI
jgi:hypothetical protein